MFWVVQPTLFEEIMKGMGNNLKFYMIRDHIKEGKIEGFTIHEDYSLILTLKMCIHVDSMEVMKETYYNRYSVHPGGSEMYKDLKLMFWWSEMKKNIANELSGFLIY